MLYKIKAETKGWYVARELKGINLIALTDPGMLGRDAFSMVVFQTESGAIYKIYEKPERDSCGVNFMLTKKGWGEKEYHIPDSEMEKLRIRLGESFIYSNGNTTPVTRLFGVCARSVWMELDYLELLIPKF